MELIKYDLSDLIKFNPHHAPAGSPDGGQFSAADMDAAQAKGKKHLAAAEASEKAKNEPGALAHNRAALAYFSAYGSMMVGDAVKAHEALGRADAHAQLAEGSALLKYNEHHEPGGSPIGGQFASAGGSAGISSSGAEDHAKQLEAMLERVRQPDGGFTYNPMTGQEAASGYAVSPYPDRSFAIDAKTITPDHVDDYVQKNLDRMTQPDHFIGAWHDPVSGKAFLDVSVVVKTPEEAHRLALAHDQKAYFDFQTFKSVEVNAQATSGGVAKGEFYVVTEAGLYVRQARP